MIYRRLREGDRTGEYILERLTFRTDFEETWLGRHHLLDRNVLVMVTTDEQGLGSLRDMGVIQHGLDHPAVIKTLGLNLDKNPPYLVLEHVEGRPLREVITSDAPLPWQSAAALCRGILEGLAYAHEKGHIHANLRPESIIVDGDDKPHLTGFGRRMTREDKDDLLSDSLGEEDREAAREAVYFPADPEPPGPSFDVYSSGVLLFEMLTGGLPQGSEIPSDLVEGLPDAADNIFRKAYTSLNLRYPDAPAMIEALQTSLPAKASTVLSVPTPGFTVVKSARTCPKCGIENRMEFRFCTSCGSQMGGHGQGLCRICGKGLTPSGKFCTFCGAGQG